MVEKKYTKIISLLIFLILICFCFSGCRKEVKVDLQEPVLFEATSIAMFDENTDTITIPDIPPNACITKIYASALQEVNNPIDGGELILNSMKGMIFQVRFHKDPGDTVGYYETTFLQPLSIGSGGGSLTLKTSYQSNDQKGIQISMDVLYYIDKTGNE